MIRKVAPEQALQRLETLCVRGEQCRFDLASKLSRWGISSSVSYKIMQKLEDRNFFNDDRFAKAFVHDKLIFNRWGKMKISLALRAKRIDSQTLREALDTIDEEEYETIARDYLKSKARSIKEGFTYEGRTRLYRYGMSRGFESQLVAKIVKDRLTWGEGDFQD